ncbi:MAG: neutral/alkaline non-lysosomal ceramidase N-terminal domain-containing protein [Planctomycetes bacterium]|nr:neutral/alkaline non-lysosomal ceramidase N-terminal domain-containing protein [Planctomycetota bacterium]
MRYLVATYVAALVTCSLLASTAIAAEPAQQFRAGAATSNITPLLGEPIVGGFSPFPSKHIHDELHARCLVLDDGATRIGIVVCDNLGLNREICDAAKKLASTATGIPTNRILISATHTHSGPPARGSRLLEPNQPLTDYQQLLIRRIADGLTRANNNLEPARVGWGAGSEPSQVFNRRWRMKTASDMENPFGGVDQVRMNPPGGSPNLIEPAGPTDPQISFLSVQSVDGRPISLVANYSLHYVGGVGDGHVSADYFGVFAQRMTELFDAGRQGRPFVAMLSNGTSGDINNINFRQPRGRQAPYEQMQRVANMVAAETFRAHQAIEFKPQVSISMLQRELTLATRRPTTEQLERAKKLVSGEQKPSHKLDVVYANRTIDLADAPAEVTIVLQAIRIGDLTIVTSPFETFAETGLELKQRSPFPRTFTIELANGSYGYLPTPEQHRLGGYETWLGTNRVEVNASRKLTDTLVGMLEELRSEGK